MRLVGSLLLGADELVAQMVATRIPHMGVRGFGHPSSYVAHGVVRQDKAGNPVLLGGVVWHNFTGATIEMSGAFDRADWIRPSTLRALFYYPFTVAGCRNLITITPRKNKRARKLDEFLGFKIVGVIDDAYPNGGDAVVYQMPRSHCRWLEKPAEMNKELRNGQALSAAYA